MVPAILVRKEVAKMMNYFEDINNYNKKIGNVIESMKGIEYFIDCIIINHINPKNTDFFRHVILNSSIISIGAKIKLINTICMKKGRNYDSDQLHQLISIRNLFAHEHSYVEDKDDLVKMDQLKNDGKYVNHTFEDLYKKYFDLFNEVNRKLITLLNELNTANLLLDRLKEKLRSSGVDICGEGILGGIDVLTIGGVVPPGEKVPKGDNWQRTEMYKFDHFFIKNHDWGKFSKPGENPLEPIQELSKEIKAWKKYSSPEIPIVEKVAILSLKESNEVFLVEKLLVPYDSKKWQEGWQKEAEELVSNARKRFPKGDFDLKNIGFDPHDKQLKFFDVFPGT